MIKKNELKYYFTFKMKVKVGLYRYSKFQIYFGWVPL